MDMPLFLPSVPHGGITSKTMRSPVAWNLARHAVCDAVSCRPVPASHRTFKVKNGQGTPQFFARKAKIRLPSTTGLIVCNSEEAPSSEEVTEEEVVEPESSQAAERAAAQGGRVLAIGGSDSGGGAGIQGDTKTITALGGYAFTAITAVTAQNSRGVWSTVGMMPEFVRSQIELVVSDLGVDCIKTGMMHRQEILEAVVETICNKATNIPVVVDPVLTSKRGKPLLEPAAISLVRELLIPLADVVTPNVPEAEVLTGIRVEDMRSMMRAAEYFTRWGARVVVLKGGHLRDYLGGNTWTGFKEQVLREQVQVLGVSVTPAEERDPEHQDEPNAACAGAGTPAAAQAVEMDAEDLAPEIVPDLLFTADDGRFRLLETPRIDTLHSHGTGCAFASAIATGIAQNMPIEEAVLRAKDFVYSAMLWAPGYGSLHGPMNHGFGFSPPPRVAHTIDLTAARDAKPSLDPIMALDNTQQQ